MPPLLSRNSPFFSPLQTSALSTVFYNIHSSNFFPSPTSSSRPSTWTPHGFVDPSPLTLIPHLHRHSSFFFFIIPSNLQDFIIILFHLQPSTKKSSMKKPFKGAKYKVKQFLLSFSHFAAVVPALIRA
jgi:hypothetical protein